MATVLEKPEVSNALPPAKVKGRQSAMHIPDGGYFPDKVEQGRFGPIFPRTPLNYGFTIIAKIKPGTEENFHNYARNIEAAVAATPDVLDVLKLHTLKWRSSTSRAAPTSCTRASSTPTSTNIPRMRSTSSRRPRLP